MADNVLNDWVINSGGGSFNRFVFPKGRSLCVLTEVKQITMERGARYCKPELGQKPEDRVPKVLFCFMPLQDKVLSLIPEGYMGEINAMFSPSFGPGAYLPPFLIQLSEDGVVPDFGKDGNAFRNWCNMHVGYYYAVNHEPNKDKTRNNISSIAFHSKGDRAQTPTVKTGAEAKRVAAAQPPNPIKPAAVQTEVPFSDDDIPF